MFDDWLCWYAYQHNQRSERWELDNLFFENVKSKRKQLIVRYMDQSGTGHNFADPKWT